MKFFRRSKGGSETVTNVLGAISIAAIVVIFFYYIFPLFFGDVFKSIALSSAEIVARDMAGFVSVSGVAPNEIKIEYNPSSSVLYDLQIKDRIVKIFLEFEKNVPINVNIKVNEKENVAQHVETFSGKELASAKTAVDNLFVQIIGENNFEISKTVITRTDKNGNKIFDPMFSVVGKSNQGV